MTSSLTLDLPWGPEENVSDVVKIRRGHQNVLAFDDGVTLEVVLLDPASSDSVQGLVNIVRSRSLPGRVVLVAGKVPPSWRAELRVAGVSWLDPSGIFELHWPRVEVNADSFYVKRTKRRRLSLGLQQGRAVVAQVLCEAAIANEGPMLVADLAERAGVTLSIASRTTTDLVAHGLASKAGGKAPVYVLDRSALARAIAERTEWQRSDVEWGYIFGASALDIAARISSAVQRDDVKVAVTGRTAAAYLGILGTGEAGPVRLRAMTKKDGLRPTCRQLGIEVVSREEANVVVAADPWGLGYRGARWMEIDRYRALVASPLRVWCDVADEPRGTEFAAQLWGMMTSDQ